MISRLLLAPIILLISSPALSEVDKEIHEMCLAAADYKGCVSINQSQPKLDTTVNKEETNTSSELEAEQNQEDAEDSSKQASPKKLSAYGITDYRTAHRWCKKNLNGIDNDIFKTNDPFDKKTISESDFCRQYFIKLLQSANGEICGECDLDPNIILTNSSEELKQSLESNYIENSLIEDSFSTAKVNNENLLSQEITPSAISASEGDGDDSEEKTFHNACKDVRDYKGCIEMKSGQINKYAKGTREIPRKDDSITIFHPDAVIAKEVRGEYGRYLNYRYYRVGQNTEWSADADCEDYTVNWKGDRGGWLDVKVHQEEKSQEALKILDEFCPQMDRLVKEAKSGSQPSFNYPIVKNKKTRNIMGGLLGIAGAINRTQNEQRMQNLEHNQRLIQQQQHYNQLDKINNNYNYEHYSY